MGHWHSWLARIHGMDEVIGSNPICSTKSSTFKPRTLPVTREPLRLPGFFVPASGTGRNSAVLIASSMSGRRTVRAVAGQPRSDRLPVGQERCHDWLLRAALLRQLVRGFSGSHRRLRVWFIAPRIP